MILSENALVVLKSRYLQKDESGNIIETPEQLFERVAKAIAAADKNYGADNRVIDKTIDEFYEVMTEVKFLPNTPTLVNAGRPLGQLSACFVLPVNDSMESIFDAVKATALIHKSGGGTGFSFSKLRPKNDIVSSTMGVSSGPVSFMKVFDCATEAIKQGGVRRGANMGILRVDHPDIVEFIHCKDKEGEFKNFNISVAITDKFLKALENDDEYELINPRNGEIISKLKASFVWDEIAKGAHKNGEPGIIFIDVINKKHTLSKEVGLIESTNPCGEQPLLPYESCNLGSINLSKFVKKPEGSIWNIDIEEKLEKFIDWKDLEKTVYTAVHFLDNVIDVNKYPIKEIEDNTKKNRKIGLGVMGFADLLIDLGIAYNSQEATKAAEKIMGFIQKKSKEASSDLANSRGNFPNYKHSIYAKDNIPMRNATTTTIAPTGSISMIADASSGIEPIFALAYYKQVLDGKRLPYVYERLFDVLKEKDIYSEKLAEKIIDNRGSIQDIEEIPEDIKKVFVSAMDISYKAHIDIQAAFQKYTDNAVSKTINMANSVTVEDVKEAYNYAYQKGLKGVTVYRDGSRQEQVLIVPKKEEKSVTVSNFSRPVVLKGFTEKVKTSRGTLYVTVNTINNKPIEVFANIGKSGGDISALSEAIGRLISIALQNGVHVKSIINTLISITGAQPIWNNGRLIKSVPDAVAQILRDHFLRDGKKLEQPKKIVGEECPECGSPLEIVEGCAVCRNCGYSRCG